MLFSMERWTAGSKPSMTGAASCFGSSKWDRESLVNPSHTKAPMENSTWPSFQVSAVGPARSWQAASTRSTARPRSDSRMRCRISANTRPRAECYMFFRFFSVLLLAVLPGMAAHQAVLRVCADPNNMPFSNDQGQGFENKLAELIAGNLGAKLEYVWWSQRKSFIRNSLDEGRCDLIMGIPSSLSSVTTTKPYYRSTYVFVSRHDGNLQVASL